MSASNDTATPRIPRPQEGFSASEAEIASGASIDPADVARVQASSAPSLEWLRGALAGAAKHALNHVANGVDIIIAQGYEAGGHTGEIAGMVLTPDIVDAVGPEAATKIVSTNVKNFLGIA